MEIIVKCASGKCPKTSKDVEKRFRNRIFKQNFVREICGEDEKITQRESLYFIQIKGVRELWDIRNEVEC
ncbi:MAG: hypothetical protein GWN86_30225, partial [Desulfobacterales bacterium]|nr:hypothetical protein [Desulfobacterales bacterium]